MLNKQSHEQFHGQYIDNATMARTEIEFYFLPNDIRITIAIAVRMLLDALRYFLQIKR